MRTLLSKVVNYQVIFYDKDNESHEFNYPDIQKLAVVSAKIKYIEAKVVKANFWQKLFGSKLLAVQTEKEFVLAPKSELKICIHSNNKVSFLFSDPELVAQLENYDPKSIKKRHLFINGLTDKIITHVANISEIKYVST